MGPLEPRRGKVLHLLERSLPLWQSGSTLRSARTVRAQADAGLSPEVVTQPGFGSPGVESVDGIPHHRLPRTVGREATLDERLRDYLAGASAVVDRVRPAVLHAASDYVNALVALELGRRRGLPVVYEVRGFPELARGRWGASRVAQEKAQWRTQLEADCRRRADRVVTLAGVMRDHVVARGVDPARVRVVPNAVDADRFRPAAPDPALRERLGLPETELVLGYVSLLYVMEGLPTLLDAAARLVAGGRPVRVLLVGDGLERPYLRALARRLGIADRVVLTGRVPHEQVGAYLSLIDLFVVPRLDVDDFSLVTPLKPFEAMAAGTPVIASRVPALEEVLDGGRVGALFAPGDAEDLARVVEELAADSARRRALCDDARAWVAEQRTWAGNARSYRRLYEELGAL
jgi:glycosyltransferase involved in cell wall biosynthesis